MLVSVMQTWYHEAMIELTENQRQVVETYVAAKAKYERLNAAEDRAFKRFMEGTGPRSSVRSAASRVNAFSPDFYSAEGEVYSLMDELQDAGKLSSVYHADPAKFVQEVSQ